MCVCNFLEVMRCEWDVLWHHKASVCWTLSVRVAGVCHWLHLSLLGKQNPERRGGKKKTCWRSLTELVFSITAASCFFIFLGWGYLSIGCAFLHGGSTPSRLHWKVLTLDVKRSGSHLGKGGVWYSRVTAQPREKWKCSVFVLACTFQRSGKWLVINIPDTPGLPYTFNSRFFWGGLVTFSSPFVRILQYWIHLDFVLSIFHFAACSEHDFVHYATLTLDTLNKVTVTLKASFWPGIQTSE